MIAVPPRLIPIILAKKCRVGGRSLNVIFYVLAVQHGGGEWDTEYAMVSNAILPFARCAAHVGGEGWGSDSASFGDLQVRVYSLDESADTVNAMIERKAPSAVTKLTDEPTELERSTQDGWRRVLLKYFLFYQDYGATAHVDIRFREFATSTVVFVFMYTNYKEHADVISAILGSFITADTE